MRGDAPTTRKYGCRGEHQHSSRGECPAGSPGRSIPRELGRSVRQAHAECERPVQTPDVPSIQPSESGPDPRASDRHGLVGHDLRRPSQAVRLEGAIVIRKSGASVSVEVIWHTMTDACSCGNTSLWTTTAGRGSPKSPAAATVTTSPRLRRIEVRHRLDPCQRLRLACGVETGDRIRDARPHFLAAGVRHGESDLAFRQPAATFTQGPHPLCRGCRRDPRSLVHEAL